MRRAATLGRGVGVPGQLDRDQPAVAAVEQGAQHRREVDLAVPNSRCSCTPRRMSSICTFTSRSARGAHAPTRHRFEARAVPDVEGHAERRRGAERGPQPQPAGDVLDEHAGLGLEPERHAAAAGARRPSRTPSTSRRQALSRRHVGRPHAGPAARRPRRRGRRAIATARRRKSIRRPLVVEQRRRVLARTGRAGSARRSRRPRRSRGRRAGRRRRDPAGGVGRERVEVRMVQGQRDARVPEVGDHRDRVVQPVVGESVGAVAEPNRAGQRATVASIAVATASSRDVTRPSRAAAPAATRARRGRARRRRARGR